MLINQDNYLFENYCNSRMYFNLGFKESFNPLYQNSSIISHD